MQSVFVEKLGAVGEAWLADANKDDSRDKAALAQFEGLADLRTPEANQLFDTIAASLRDHMKKEEEVRGGGCADWWWRPVNSERS